MRKPGSARMPTMNAMDAPLSPGPHILVRARVCDRPDRFSFKLHARTQVGSRSCAETLFGALSTHARLCLHRVMPSPAP